MPKTLPSDVKTVFSGATIRPRYLLTLVLDSGTQRYCTGKANINFPTAGGNTYTARGFEFNAVRSSVTLEVDRVQLAMDNIDGTLTTYFDEIQGALVTLTVVELSKLGSSSNALTLFSGIAGAPSLTDTGLSFPVLSHFAKLAGKFPHRQLSGPCPWVFDSAQCRKTNLVTNPYFESYTAGSPDDAFTGWTLVDTGGDVAFSAVEQFYEADDLNSNYGMRITYSTEPSNWYDAIAKQAVTLVSGAQYSFSCWVKVSAACTVYVRVAELDSSNMQSQLDAAISTTDTWQQLTGTFTCDATADQYVWFGSSAASGYVYVTGLILSKVLAFSDTGAAEAGSTASQIIDTANRSEADDYWNSGIIEFTSGDLDGESRQITTSVNATGAINVIPAFSAAPDATDAYTIKRGCDKYVRTCWVAHDNWINYGGFKTLPKES